MLLAICKIGLAACGYNSVSFPALEGLAVGDFTRSLELYEDHTPSLDEHAVGGPASSGILEFPHQPSGSLRPVAHGVFDC